MSAGCLNCGSRRPNQGAGTAAMSQAAEWRQAARGRVNIGTGQPTLLEESTRMTVKPQATAMDRLLAMRKSRTWGPWATRMLLLIYGLALPMEVQLGNRVSFIHGDRGTVVHPLTRIGDDVKIYHGVTIGRRDAHLPYSESAFRGIEIGDHSVIFAGAVVLGGPGTTVVGRGSLIAANAVLQQSTGEWEIWGGVPARVLGHRPQDR